MEFIKPNSISGEIMNIFDEAKEKVIIVSPYCKFGKWFKLVNKIKDLQSRNIEIEFYIRDGEIEALEQVLDLGIQPILVPNLHAKMYLNEKAAIVTSMNLLLSSEINSIDIGYKTSNEKEYNELMDFYNTYLVKAQKNETNIKDWRETLDDKLTSKISRARIFENEGSFHIKTPSNNYTVFIANDRDKNVLRLSGILSGTEFEYSKSKLADLHTDTLTYEVYDATKGYDSIWATQNETLRSNSINFLKTIDSEEVINSIVNFIVKVEDIKDYCYKNRKSLT